MSASGRASERSYFFSSPSSKLHARSYARDSVLAEVAALSVEVITSVRVAVRLIVKSDQTQSEVM